MKSIPFSLLALGTFLFIGCGPGKVIIQEKIVTRDSIQTKEVLVEVPRIEEEFIVDDLCKEDVPVIVNKTFVVGGDSLKIATDSLNRLTWSYSKQADTIVRLRDSLATSVTKTEATKVQTIYRIEWKWTLAAFVVGVIVGMAGMFALVKL